MLGAQQQAVNVPPSQPHGAVVGAAGSQGPVTIFDFGDSPHVAYAEGHEAGRIIEAPADMAKLVKMFDHLRAGR